MSLILPSYKQGFARYAAESAYPGLWTRLQGLWAPSLGPTGLTLFDWSGHGNRDGTLNNMELDTDWILTGDDRIKGYALNFGGTNEYVQTPIIDITSWTAMTQMVWFKPSDLTDLEMIFDVRYAGNDGCRLHMTSGGELRYEADDGTVVRTQVILGSVTEYHQMVGIIDNNRSAIELCLDGKLVDSDTDTFDFAGANGTVDIGARNSGNLPFTGEVALAALWDRSLLPSEVQFLYTNPLALLQLRSRNVAGVTAAPAVGHPTMKRWQQIKHMHSLSGVA